MLNSINWDVLSSFNDAQVAYDYFSETFLTIFNLHFPLLTKTINKNTQPMNPWMTKGLLISRKQKIFLCSQSLKNPSEHYISLFKNYRNLYAKTVREAKKKYFQDQLEQHQSNIKKTWEIIRKAINNKSKKSNSIQTILVDNVVFSDPHLIANKFNEFFSKVASEIVQKIHPPSKDIPPVQISDNGPNFSFTLNPLTTTEVSDAIAQLKSKHTLDFEGISTTFLKKISDVIVKPLYMLFKNSLETGVIPSQLKIAKIIPLLKTGDASFMDNYRPIALLSCFSKVLEKIVCNRLTNYLEYNNLISNFQFGFRKDHSTLHPLILFSNHVTKALENREHTIAI